MYVILLTFSYSAIARIFWCAEFTAFVFLGFYMPFLRNVQGAQRLVQALTVLQCNSNAPLSNFL